MSKQDTIPGGTVVVLNEPYDGFFFATVVKPYKVFNHFYTGKYELQLPTGQIIIKSKDYFKICRP